MRVPWTARRPNQSTLKEISPEINPEYSLEGLMLKLMRGSWRRALQFLLLCADRRLRPVRPARGLRPADSRCSGCIPELPGSAGGRLQRCLEGGLVRAPSRAPRGSRQVGRAGARGDPGREGGRGRGLGPGRGSPSPRGLRAGRDPRPGTCFRGASGTLFAGLTRGGGDG